MYVLVDQGEPNNGEVGLFRIGQSSIISVTTGQKPRAPIGNSVSIAYVIGNYAYVIGNSVSIAYVGGLGKKKSSNIKKHFRSLLVWVYASAKYTRAASPSI